MGATRHERRRHKRIREPPDDLQPLAPHARRTGTIAGDQERGDGERGHRLSPLDLRGDDAGAKQCGIRALTGPHAHHGLGVGHLGVGQGACHRGRGVGDLGAAGSLAPGTAGEQFGRTARAVTGRVVQNDAADQLGAATGHHHGGGGAHGVADDDGRGRVGQTESAPTAGLDRQVLQDGHGVVDEDLASALELVGLPTRGQAVTAGVHGDHPIAQG